MEFSARVRAAQEHWLLATLHAVTTAESVCNAAAALHLHHSTVQERIVRAGQLLGWDIATPSGRFRTQLALTLRRTFNTASADEPGKTP